MTYSTTLGWSLLTSGLVTLVIGFLPLGDVFWVVLLLVAGAAVLLVRQT
jgi:hypothetical protein